MSKRNSENKIEYYKQKIRKIENKSKNRRRVIIYSSSSDSEENYDVGGSKDEEMINISLEKTHGCTERVQTEVSPEVTTETVLVAPTCERMDPDELDPELLTALGDAVDDQPGFGENIHQSLALRWLPILKKGLTKETKDKLLKEYLIPENCQLLMAPTLNPEIAAAVPYITRCRDKFILSKQNQLGQGIAAISKALTLLLLGDDKIQAIKIITDACRLLTDLHFEETQVRTKLLSPKLERSFLSVIQNQERDDTLFGKDLPEKIKTSKAIEKQGYQIKKPSPMAGIQKQNPSTSKSPYQGNWMGPPRYAMSSRGGRTGMSNTAYTASTPVAATYRRPAPVKYTHPKVTRGRPRAARH